jgi:hypothetical protein
MSRDRRKLDPEMLNIHRSQHADYADYADYADPKELPEPTAFPTSALPRQVRSLVEEAEAAIDCPPEFIAVPLLVMLGSAIGNARRVRLKQGWTEGAAIFAAVVADAGEKKTPASKVAVEAAVRAQARMRNDHRDKRDEYARELRQYEVDKADARKDGMAAPPPPEEPVMSRALVEDTTTEALAAVLEGNPRGVLVMRDELAAWAKSMDQYRSGGKGADRQFWLSAWSGSYVSVDRKGRAEPLVLPVPFVGLFGSIQPSVLPEIGAGREDGLMDRILFAYPETTPSRWSDDEISDGAIGGVRWLYDKLRRLEPGEDENGDPEPVTVRLSPEAKPVLVELFNNHRAEMDAPGFPGRLRGPWAKLEAYLARLTLIVAMCRVATHDAPELIESEDVLRASILLDYFKNHARRVYVGLHGSDRIDALAGDVARFLEELGGHWKGQPTELYNQLDSRHKPERAKDLSADLAKAAQRSSTLTFGRGHPERYTKEDGTEGRRRVWELKLTEAA